MRISKCISKEAFGLGGIAAIRKDKWGPWPRQHGRHKIHKKSNILAMGTMPTGHESPPNDAAPPPCRQQQWRLLGRPQKDVDGAASKSCTRRRRGAFWPPATKFGETPASRGGRASGYHAHQPAVVPSSLSGSPKPLPSPSSWWKRKGGGIPPAAGRACPRD
jgi:hypothetical protein